MPRLIALLVRYGLPLVFANVFLEQIGAPLPALPTLIVAGALSRDGKISSTYVMLAAVLASVLADWIWFVLGRRYGYRILRTLCRISLSPDSCVRDTEANFERWGMRSLLFAKFIPGFSTVAPPLAGTAGASTLQFLLYDTIGSFLWAGVAVAIGRTFHRAFDRVFATLENLGWWAIVVLVSALALFILVKWWQRLRFYKHLRMSRVTVDQLQQLMQSEDPPLIVDVRSGSSRRKDPHRIPTAIVASREDVRAQVRELPPHKDIVLYCT
ncbi:MAG: VTT domain-containing protein [Acidobacteriota bacterium]